MKKKCRKLLSLLTVLCLVLSMTPLAALAAEGENPLQTLQAQINGAASGATVTLTEDTTESIVISDGKDITLNLAGHKLTNEAGKHTISVEDGGTLTITGNGTVDNVSHAKASVYNMYGTVTIENGTFTRSAEASVNGNDGGGNSWYVIYNAGTMKISDGTFKFSDGKKGLYSSLIVNGWPKPDGNEKKEFAEMTISGGNFEGGKITIKNDDYGKLTVKGGTFTQPTETYFVVMNWNEAEISDGEFNGEIYAEGGATQGNYEQGKLTIKGGTFTQDVYTDENKSDNIASISIEKGTFATDVTRYVADKSVCTGTEGNYTVAPLGAENAVAQIGENYYKTLVEAVAAAKANDTVKLLKDTETAATVTVEKGITLDLNEHILTIVNGNDNSSAIGLKFTAGESTLKNGTVSDDRSRNSDDAVNLIAICVVGNAKLTTSDVIVQTYQPNNGNGYNYLLRAEALNDQVGSLTLKPGTVVKDLEKTNKSATTYGGVGVAVIGPSDSKEYTNTENLTIEDGVEINTMGYAIAGSGVRHGTKIVIDGGIIKSYGSAAIYHPQAGVLTMNGGTLTGLTGVQLCSGEGTTGTNFQLNGGTIRGTGEDERENKGTGDGVVSDGAAISLVNRNYPGGAPSITITGGYYSSAENDAVVAYTWNSGESSEWTEAKDYLKISGGYYTSDVNAYVEDGYEAASGSWKVEEQTYGYKVAKAEPNKIASVKVASVQDGSQQDTKEDVSASLSGNTISLVGMVANTSTITVSYTTEKETASEPITVTYDESAKAFKTSLQGELKVGETTYTVDLSGLLLKPLTVDVAKPKAEAKPAEALKDNELAKAAAQAAEETSVEGLAAAATSEIKTDDKGDPISVGGVKPEDAAEKLKADGDITDEEKEKSVNMVIQPRLNIEVTGVDEVDGKKSITLEIKPVYDVIATTATKLDDIKLQASGSGESSSSGRDKNAVIVAENQPMTVTTATTITIPLPDGLGVTETTTDLFVQHVKNDGRVYNYKAKVTKAKGNYFATFTVTHGFSKFTILADDRVGTIDFEDAQIVKTYTRENLGETLPTASKSGFTFAGWKIGDKVYTTLTDELLETIKGNTVVATAEFTTGGGGGGEPEEWVNPFKDVKEKDWFYDAVKYTNQKKLFGGTAADKFGPEETMTRGMLVTVLHRLEGEPVVGTKADFSDVKQTEYYAEPVNWAAANKIVGGYDGKFNPEDAVTREEMAAILHRYASYKKYDVSATASLEGFRDGAKTSGWAVDDMKWAVGAGMFFGRENNTLAPGGTATRAEVAQIMMRFCEKFVTE